MVMNIFSAKNDNQLTNSTETGCFQERGWDAQWREGELSYQFLPENWEFLVRLGIVPKF